MKRWNGLWTAWLAVLGFLVILAGFYANPADVRSAGHRGKAASGESGGPAGRPEAGAEPAAMAEVEPETPEAVPAEGHHGGHGTRRESRPPVEPVIRRDGSSSFHVVGTLFDRVYLDGNPANVMEGMQTVLLPASGGMVAEFTVTEAGDYPVVTHQFNHATKGATAILRVTEAD